MKKILSIIPYLIIVSIGLSCYKLVSSDNAEGILTFISTVLSLVITFLAYMIANNTYKSIDSVNIISQMEGNVLENEHYVISTTQLLKEYKMPDSVSLGTAVFNKLEEIFTPKKVTAIDFADKLQYFIDIIIFFPYLFKTKDDIKEEHIQRMKKILSMIEKRKRDLFSISKGNIILIEETVKLIQCIINYQQLVYTTDQKTALTILEVRGSMLKNPVTQIVYYNYLGLFYNAKANHVLRKKFNLQKADFFSINVLKFIKNNIGLLSDEEKELFRMYLWEAKKAFQKALTNCNDDMMWEGFIKFNEARTTYLLRLVDDPGEDWVSIMNSSIVARNRINILIKDVLNDEIQTHLQKAFIYEGFFASFVKMNILIAEDMDITDSFGRVKYMEPKYDGLLDDLLIKEPYNGGFRGIREYQERIKTFLRTLDEQRGA